MKQEYEIRETWVSYELHPETPPNGILYSELFKGRDLSGVREQIRIRGAEFGLVFSERPLLSNSKLALEASEFARDAGRYEYFHEAIFHAYFTEGLNIGDRGVIAGISESCGLDRDELQRALDERRFLPRLEAARNEGEAIGLTGVPTFIVDRKYKIVGAQNPDVFRDLFKKITSPETA